MHNTVISIIVIFVYPDFHNSSSLSVHDPINHPPRLAQRATRLLMKPSHALLAWFRLFELVTEPKPLTSLEDSAVVTISFTGDKHNGVTLVEFACKFREHGYHSAYVSLSSSQQYLQ
jgi:hypothetical protein